MIQRHDSYLRRCHIVAETEIWLCLFCSLNYNRIQLIDFPFTHYFYFVVS